MGVLFEHARRVFGGRAAEPPPPEPFAIACACGESFSGFRKDQRQFLGCPRCGQVLFVLPRSLYPAPAPVAVLRSAGARVEPAVQKRPLGVRLRVRARRTRRRLARALWRFVPPRRWFSTGRLVAAGIVLAVIGTTMLTVYLTGRSRLTANILERRGAWTRALERGDFAVARSELDAATAAMRRFGSRGPEEVGIEQLAREVAIYDDRLDTPLEQLIAREVQNKSPDEWSRYVQANVRGRALVFDARVHVSDALDAAAGDYELGYAFFVGDEAGRWEVSRFALFESVRERLPARLLFGARIESIERAPGSAVWTVQLSPASGVLLTSPLCLEKAAWPLDAEMRSRLETQAEWLGGR